MKGVKIGVSKSGFMKDRKWHNRRNHLEANFQNNNNNNNRNVNGCPMSISLENIFKNYFVGK